MTVSHGGLLRSPPCKVFMAGWSSDTYTLQQHGWEISMDQNVYHGNIRLAMRHPAMKCVAMSIVSDYEFTRRRDRLQREEWPEFRVNAFSGQIHVQHEHSQVPFKMFQPVDCTPFMDTWSIKNIEDLILFAPARAKAQEIIVDEREVADLLAEIMDKQKPKQAQIRDRMYREQERAKLYAPDIG